MRLSEEQLRRVVAQLESTPWADVEGSIETLDAALKLALEITRDEFAVWHTQLEPAGYENEFDEVLVRDLPTELKGPLVARLLRTIALMYGVGTEFGAHKLGEPRGDVTHVRTTVRTLLELVS